MAPKRTTKHAEAMTPAQAYRLLGGPEVVSRSTFYAAIKAGRIPHIRIGRKRLIIPKAAFMRWLQLGSGAGE
jgi:excisionase family DNA binding protein